MSTLFLCTFQSCCFIFQIAAQSACFRHNRIIAKEYVPYEYTGIRKLSGKNLPWKPFISIYHLSVFYPTGFFLCADPLAWRNGDYLYKEGTRHYHRGLHTIPGQCRNARTYHSGTITFDWTIRKRKYGIWKYYFSSADSFIQADRHLQHWLFFPADGRNAHNSGTLSARWSLLQRDFRLCRCKRWNQQNQSASLPAFHQKPAFHAFLYSFQQVQFQKCPEKRLQISGKNEVDLKICGK